MEQKVQQRKVNYIAPTLNTETEFETAYRQIRVAAYCRVSTQMEEQLNSYEVQVKHYTDKINSEPKWSFAGIYADKGISGTSAKKRDEFMKMIRACKRHKIDMIITKSISRFSRNTLDCLKYIRILKELNVDVFFEEQGLHSKDAGAEFYITIYGSIAQSEAENISANVKWGKQQSAKEGKVTFSLSTFLVYIHLYKNSDLAYQREYRLAIGIEMPEDHFIRVGKFSSAQYIESDKLKDLYYNVNYKTVGG